MIDPNSRALNARRLLACRIELVERRGLSIASEVTHTDYLILSHAPNALRLRCANAACRDGGHDLSESLLTGFREYRVKFRGEHVCGGNADSAPCGRVLTFVATAEYRKIA